MDLVYTHYNKGDRSSYFYFIPFFQKSPGELAGLRTTVLHDTEVRLIKEKATEIDMMTDEEKYLWMMENIANFRASYRTLHTKYIIEAFPYRINANG
jgi:hypothetical protein